MLIYRVPPKNVTFSYAFTSSNIDYFQTYFTVRIRRNFVIILSLKILPENKTFVTSQSDDTLLRCVFAEVVLFQLLLLRH